MLLFKQPHWKQQSFASNSEREILLDFLILEYVLSILMKNILKLQMALK